jgi:hypothetical protein
MAEILNGGGGKVQNFRFRVRRSYNKKFGFPASGRRVTTHGAGGQSCDGTAFLAGANKQKMLQK